MGRYPLFQIKPVAQGLRLDAFLAKELPEVSRALARKACEQKQVLVNGKPRRAGYLLSLNDQVELTAELAPVVARAELAEEQGGPLAHIKILFEDEHLLAVNKRRMMHSVTLRLDDPLSVADCLAAYSAAAAGASSDPREAGLVQRLDYYTSGVMLAAKNDRVWQALHQLLLGEQVEKEYIALVEGKVAQKTSVVHAPLVDADGGRKVKVADDGRPAHSRLERLEVIELTDGPHSLLCVRGSGMRRHQVRAHLAHIGHPLMGDSLYGARQDHFKLTTAVEFLGGKQLEGEGFYLHAASIRCNHPVTGESLHLISAV